MNFLKPDMCNKKRVLTKEELDKTHYKDQDFCPGCEGPVKNTQEKKDVSYEQ